MSFSFSRLSDPGYFRENRMDAHSDHVALDGAGNSLRMSLNGAWRFFHALNEAQVIPGFESEAYDCRSWAEIPVPAHIQMEGYGHPQYCNTQYPWDGTDSTDVGAVPSFFNPVACYVKYFTLPEGWREDRVIISFQGVESCVAVWLNGQYVGFSSDTFTPDEFELTPYLKDGENKLACRVYRFGVSSWLEDQDFYRFSGIFRDVYLQRIPRAHLTDLRVRTLLDDDYRDAVLEVEMKAEAPAGSRAVLALMDGDEEIAGCAFDIENGCRKAAMPVSAPRKWSAEVPNLYDLDILMMGPEGEVCERIRQKVGFRRFEMKDGLMLINGRRIVFKGTNRHDFCAEKGRAVPPETIRRDLITMKRNNLNAIRTSHYPNNSVLYELCDELGLYVIDECNMETHGVWEMLMKGKLVPGQTLPGDRPAYLEIMLDRVTSMLERDKNHPCILIWSCGNESYGGTVIREMSDAFRRMDDTRLVHYEGVSYDGRPGCDMDTTDMYSQMYTPAKKVREFLKSHPDKPFILCEYTHSMGNSNGAMHWYTQMAYEEPRYQGGFIWDYIDQSIRGRDRYGETLYRYGGDCDERPHDGNFSGNGICFGNGDPTPKMQEVKYNYRSIEAEPSREGILIRNRHLFRSTKDFDCVVILEKDGEEICRAPIETDVAPMSEDTVPVPFALPEKAGEYALTVSFRLREDTAWAERGYEVAYGQGVWKGTEKAKAPAPAPAPALRIVEGDRNTGVFGDGFSAMFSMEQGTLISYTVYGREMLKTPPKPVFWRAPVDNDLGNGMPVRYAQWKIADLYAVPLGDQKEGRIGGSVPEKIQRVTRNGDGSVTFRSWWMLPGAPVSFCLMEITVFPGGRTEIRLSLDPAEDRGDPPLFGVSFKTDADFDQIRYYGNGPEENYIDRKEGARLGIFTTTAKKNMTPYLRPQECGNRTGVRWAEVTDFRGRGLRFRGDGMEFNALPWTAHEIENAAHGNELPKPVYTVIRAATMQMGVGGDDSWGSLTHEEYCLNGKEKLTFSCTMEPVL
ncbi:MAG: DUF4981 domain-containing protein [Clostridia bacterium]|nr:DUF4981 domain-containing protein [Clostridia bacterium]